MQQPTTEQITAIAKRQDQAMRKVQEWIGVFAVGSTPEQLERDLFAANLRQLFKCSPRDLAIRVQGNIDELKAADAEAVAHGLPIVYGESTKDLVGKMIENGWEWMRREQAREKAARLAAAK